ncbi:MAG: ABC transporter substrate-binding protein [Faecalibacterium sp.]
MKKITRRNFLTATAAVAATAAFTACTNPIDLIAGSIKTSEEATDADALVEGEALNDDLTAQEGTITMADGEKDLPAVGGRYAILDWDYLDHLFMLDAAPVASPITAAPAEDAATSSIVSYLDGYGRFYPDRSVFDGIEAINASDDGIDLEQLLSLNLDYIITSESNIEYADKLNAIAPTFFLPSALSADADGYKDWKQIHMALATITGTVEIAEANIADYDDTVAYYQDLVGDMVDGKTAIVTQISTKGVQTSLPTNHPHVFVHYDFTTPETFPADGGTFALENLVEFDPDYLFINVESWEDFAAYEDSPIWQNLTAVKEGHVFEFAHNVWNRSNGAMAALMRVTDIGDFLLEGTQVTNRYDYLEV